jgi:tol-pal system protein YbgF
MRRYAADLGARLDKMQLDVQNLTGRFEESKYFAEKTFGETKTLRDSYQGKIEELEKKIAALNSAVEAAERKAANGETKTAAKPEGETEETNATPAKTETGKTQTTTTAKKVTEKPEVKAPLGPEDAYKKAYDLFAKGDIEGAKGGFQKFLEVHGKTKYAENAHYWLGECYFAEKKFDEAILEYDEVIKKFPKGSKVPDALFRQGMAFLEMKDAVNAKLILKEVVKRFPKSDQAAKARKKLKEI